MLDSSGIAIATMHSILVVINIVGNSLVCVIIKKNRDMRIPINYLLVNLAVADILYATFITIDTLWRLTATHPGGMTGTVLCKLLTSGLVAWIAAISSVVTLVAIAIERYYAIVHPLGDKGKLTKRKLKLTILGSWIFSLILNIPPFLVMDVKDNFCLPLWPKEWMAMAQYWFTSLFILLSVALMAGLYTRVVCSVFFKRSDDDQLSYQQRGVMKVRKRVTLMVIAVTALFGICWLTDIFVHLVEVKTSYTMDKVAYTVVHTAILFNSALNPFLYALINQNFRRKMKDMLCCKGVQQEDFPIRGNMTASSLPTISSEGVVFGIELLKVSVLSYNPFTPTKHV